MTATRSLMAALALFFFASPALAQVDPGDAAAVVVTVRPETMHRVERALFILEGEAPAAFYAALGAEGRQALLTLVADATRPVGLRRRAVLALRHYPDAGVRTALEARAADVAEDAIVSRYALRALAQAFGVSAFEVIARRLSDPRAFVREGAVIALGSLDRARAIAAVAPMLESEPEGFVRETIRSL
jgi:hypothetical protein